MELLVIFIWMLSGLLGASMMLESTNPTVISLGRVIGIAWIGVTLAFFAYSALVLSGAI